MFLKKTKKNKEKNLDSRDKENNWYDKPEDVVGVITDLYTGKVADNNSKIKTLLYYIKGTEPGYKKTTIK